MFHVYWPATACLTLVLIVGVIVFMLKHGEKVCGRVFGGNRRRPILSRDEEIS